VSKFFKALENAERERASTAGAPPAAPAPTEDAGDAGVPSTEPRAAAVTVETTAVESSTAPPPKPRRAPPPVVAPVAAPAVAPAARPELRQGAPAYGAPVVAGEAPGAEPRRAWQDLLEPVDGEPGELDDHLVSLLEPTSAAAEQYRTIRLHIENLRRERGVRVVAVSSPGRGDGKTMTAINVAGALAQSPDARVALVEVDVRHPGVARYLGLPGTRGLSTYLLDQGLAVEDVIDRPAGIGFAVVVAGPASSMPYELLKSPRITALFASLRERFDFVVVDTPPVQPYPDVGILRDLVDGFVVVVRANRTPRELVRDSLNTVGSHRVLGLIFNDDERTATAVAHVERAGWRGVLGRPLGASRAA
jgi:capsular exopolysaccharide synthesis family protein